MTLTLDLPGDVQDALTQAALEQAVTPEEAALDALRRAYGPAPTEEQNDEGDQQAHQAAFAAILDKAEKLVPDPPHSPVHNEAGESAFGEIVKAKFRRQGFNL